MFKGSTLTYRLLIWMFTWFWSLFTVGLYFESHLTLFFISGFVYAMTIYMAERYRLKVFEDEL